MAGVKETFQVSGGDYRFNFDWFDFASGAGYKTFYLAGGVTSAANQYFLTTDSSLISDDSNAGGTASTSRDLDFDITFNAPVTVAAADAIINYAVYLNGVDNNTLVTTINIYHVDSSATETLIGTVTSDTETDGDPPRRTSKCMKATLTKTSFGIGEKLRINLVTTRGGNAGGVQDVYFDPSGHVSFTDASGGTGNSTFSIAIPFVVDL